jgi:hypothetical protein
VEPTPSSRMHTNTSAARSRIHLSLLLTALLILLTPICADAQATSVRIADSACSHCHREIFNTYLSTPMANASGLARDKLIPGSYVLSSSGMKFDMVNSGGKASLNFQNQRNGVNGTLPLNYFLGSGHLGTTYLYSVDGFLFETPIAWYSDLHGYDMKPGLADMKAAPPALPMLSSCLRCHMSDVQASEPGTLKPLPGCVPFLHTGITCEACHGDAAECMCELEARGKPVW